MMKLQKIFKGRVYGPVFLAPSLPSLDPIITSHQPDDWRTIPFVKLNVTSTETFPLHGIIGRESAHTSHVSFCESFPGNGLWWPLNLQ